MGCWGCKRVGSTEGLRCARIGVPAVVPGLRCARIGGCVGCARIRVLGACRAYGCAGGVQGLGTCTGCARIGVCHDEGVPGLVCAVHVGVSHVHGVPPSLPRATARPRCPCPHVTAVAALFLPLPSCSLFWALLEASKGGVHPPTARRDRFCPLLLFLSSPGTGRVLGGGVWGGSPTHHHVPPPQSTPPSASTCSRSAPPPSSSTRTWCKSCWAPQVSGRTAYGEGHEPQTSYSWLCGSSQRSYSWLWGGHQPQTSYSWISGGHRASPQHPQVSYSWLLREPSTPRHPKAVWGCGAPTTSSTPRHAQMSYSWLWGATNPQHPWVSYSWLWGGAPIPRTSRRPTAGYAVFVGGTSLSCPPFLTLQVPGASRGCSSRGGQRACPAAPRTASSGHR